MRTLTPGRLGQIAAHSLLLSSLIISTALASDEDNPEPTGICSKLPIVSQYNPSCRLPEVKSCSQNSRIVAALYHYFYDFSDEYHTTGFTHEPQTWREFSYRKWRWHRQEVRDMINAGITLTAIDWQITPEMVGMGSRNNEVTDEPDNEDDPSSHSSSWQRIGLDRFLKGYSDVACSTGRRPALAPYINTYAIDPDNNPLTQNGYNLRTTSGLEYFFRVIAGFYCSVPQEAWARMEGKPIVFVGSVSGASEVESNFFQQISDSFFQHFGTHLYFIKQREDLDSVAKIDPKSLELATRLLREHLTYEELLIEILASDEFYLQSGGTNDRLLQNIHWKLFEENEDVDTDLQPEISWSKRERRKEEILKYLNKRRDDFHAALIARWYKQFINRSEKFGDLLNDIRKNRSSIREGQSWMSMLERGIHYDAIRVEILASSSFYEKAGNSAEVFVRRIYETLYFRCPTDAEVEPWLAFVEENKKRRRSDLSKEIRREIATRMLTDREAKRLDVFWLVAHLLYRIPGWPGYADAVFSDRGALCQEVADIASIGPGFDNTAVAGVPPQEIDRAGGSYYQEAWQRVLGMQPKPFMVFIQSWNNFHEATELTRSKEFGRDFIAFTRKYSEAYRDTGFIGGDGQCP